MPKFRKKPVVIEALQWTGENFLKMSEFCPVVGATDTTLVIPTLEGNMRADMGDWIIKGVKNEFYPCKPDIFERTYDPVD